MKTNKFFAALLMGLTIVACAQTQSEEEGEEAAAVKTAKDFQPTKAVVDSVSYLVGINFGSFIKGYNFGDLNYAQIKKGMDDFIKSEGNPRDPEFGKQFKIDPSMMNDLFNEYLQNRQNYTKAVNKEKGEKFLASNANKPGVQKTASGLQYKIIATGNDVKAGPRDTVLVNYSGKTIDGEVFDETPEGADPVRMTLNRVIPGWTEGLQLVGEGGQIELYIPAELAYGENGNQAIEPNSVLVFEIFVSEVHPFVEPGKQ